MNKGKLGIDLALDDIAVILDADIGCRRVDGAVSFPLSRSEKVPTTCTALKPCSILKRRP